ncbi:putative MHC class II antigen protein [Naja naja]|nr:putative MHC class II antigen protein [Naja naja]
MEEAPPSPLEPPAMPSSRTEFLLPPPGGASHQSLKTFPPSWWEPPPLIWKYECRFLNGTQQVRFLFREMYDRQEFARFDSNLGKHVAIAELGKVDTDLWNRDERWMQYMKAGVDRFCRQNYEALNFGAAKREERTIGRRSESWAGRGSSSLGGGGRDPPFLSWPSLGILLPGDGSASSFLLPLRAPESPSSPQDPNSPPAWNLGSL